MIEYYQRELSDTDKKRLNKDFKQKEKYLKAVNERMTKTCYIFLITFVVGAIIFFNLLAKKIDNIFLFIAGTAFTCSPIGIFVFIKTIINNKKEILNTDRSLQLIFEKNTVKVTHCVSDKMIEFEEFEDEGADYLFQVEESKIFHLSSQDYCKNRKFPNTDFEIVKIFGINDAPADIYISCFGQRLESKMVITANIKNKNYEKICDLPELFEGDLDKINEILETN